MAHDTCFATLLCYNKLVEKLRRWLSLKGGDAYESKHQNL